MVPLVQLKRLAVKRACCCYSGSEARWAERSKRGRSSAQLLSDVGEELGIEGGGSSPWGWVWYKGGKNPSVVAKDSKWKVLAEIKGKELLRIVSEVFNVWSKPAKEYENEIELEDEDA